MNIFNKFVYLVFFFILITSCKKEFTDFENSKSYKISSSYTGNKYKISVLYPKNYNSNLEYPTFYLLDGNNFTIKTSEFLRDNYPSDAVLISISYAKDTKNKRKTDFTYPKDDNSLKKSGGGDKYIQFLDKELMPYIENKLSIKCSETTLIGHSLGGYFAFYQLFQQDYPIHFDNVIAASPSLWFHNGYILELENQYNAKNDTLDIKIYTTVGEVEGVTMNTFFDAFTDNLEGRNYINLSFKHKRNENKTHNDNAMTSIKNGISFILN